MTYTQLKTALEWEGKIQNNTEAIAQLDAIITDSLFVIGQAHPELLLTVPSVFPMLSQNPTPYIEALGVERVEYNPINSANTLFEIPERSQVCGPSATPTMPRYYHIEGNAATANASPKGIRVVLTPTAVSADNFTVWFKRVPVLTADADVVPPAWVPFLKKEVLHRLTLWRAKSELDISKAYKADSQQALQVEVSSNAESIAASN